MIRQSVKYVVPILASSLLIVTACGGAPVPASVPAKPASESASKPPSGPPAAPSGPASAPAPSSGTNTTPNQAAAQPANSGSASGSGSAPQSAAPAQPQSAAQQPAAPQPAPKPQQQGSQPAAPSQQPNEPRRLWTDRKVIFTTEISLLVRDLTEGVSAVGRFATAAGGFVAGVENREEQGLRVTVVKIRVPPEHYEVTMAELRKLGVEVRGEKGTTQEVTDEVSDLQTQINSLEATHKQLLELLSKAQNIDEIFKIRERADAVKMQLDRLKGRAASLERQSELATITAILRPAEGWLARDFTTQRTALRKAESNLAAARLAVDRAKTPDETNAARDRLGEISLEVDRLKARLAQIEESAARAQVPLPALPQEALAVTQPEEESVPRLKASEVPREYLETRVALRRLEIRQGELLSALRDPDLEEAKRAEHGAELPGVVLSIQQLQTKVRAIEERAKQLNVTPPPFTAELEAALVGPRPAKPQPAPEPKPAAPPSVFQPVFVAWERSVAVVTTVLISALSLIVFFWWVIPIALVLLPLLRRYGRYIGNGSTTPPSPSASPETTSR